MGRLWHGLQSTRSLGYCQHKEKVSNTHLAHCPRLVLCIHNAPSKKYLEFYKHRSSPLSSKKSHDLCAVHADRIHSMRATIRSWHWRIWAFTMACSSSQKLIYKTESTTNTPNQKAEYIRLFAKKIKTWFPYNHQLLSPLPTAIWIHPVLGNAFICPALKTCIS